MINVGLEKYIYCAKLCGNIDIETENFTKYEDRESVEAAILDMFYDTLDYGDIEIDESETELDIPDKFWEEWEQLKS